MLKTLFVKTFENRFGGTHPHPPESKPFHFSSQRYIVTRMVCEISIYAITAINLYRLLADRFCYHIQVTSPLTNENLYQSDAKTPKPLPIRRDPSFYTLSSGFTTLCHINGFSSKDIKRKPLPIRRKNTQTFTNPTRPFVLYFFVRFYETL